MIGAIPPLSQYAFMAWCLVKAQGQLYFIPSLVPAHNAAFANSKETQSKFGSAHNMFK
jgi:hypothetical protein